ncbi:MAG: metallophosphoesterase [Thermoguttaceae bacterium]|nr:metallophosphoesterase [Thermoguttaceae bacterium]
MARRTIIVGDIHGCWAELEELLEKVGLGDGDQLIALGDIVDRGPDTPKVLEFFRRHPAARSLLGNHERKHLKAFRGETKPALSQLISREQIGQAHYPDALTYFSSLPESLELPEVILVHGMWEPGKGLQEQKSEVLIGTLSGEQYLWKQLRRPWYEVYDGPKPLIVGHQNYSQKPEPFIWRDRVFGLDTDCCHGGALTALILPEFRFISVPSRHDYWTQMAQQYAHLAAEAIRIKELSWERAEALLGQWQDPSSEEAMAPQVVEELRQLIFEAQRALEGLHNYILQFTERILAALRQQGDFDQLPPQEQGRRFAHRIGNTPLASFLHLARKGPLTLAELRNYFKKPQALLQFVKRHRIPLPLDPTNPTSPDSENKSLY